MMFTNTNQLQAIVVTDSSKQMMATEQIVLRPRRGPWYGLLVFFAGVALFPWVGCTLAAGGNPADKPLPFLAALPYLFGMFLIPGVIPIGYIAWSYIAFVRMDDTGVTWREGRKNLSLRWDDVTDYYLSAPSPNAGCATVLTDVSKLVLRTDLWNVGAFKVFVEKHAQHAKTKDRREFGTRPDLDWPLDLTYNKEDERACINSTIPFFCMLTLGALAFVIYFAPGQYAQDGPSIFAMDLVMDSLPVLFIALIFGLSRYIASYRKSVQSHRISVEAEGITFDNGTSVVHATWQEVRNLNPNGLEKKRARVDYTYSIAAPDGLISFARGIHMFWELKRIIEIETTRPAQP
jgi:hypothetical protein